MNYDLRVSLLSLLSLLSLVFNLLIMMEPIWQIRALSTSPSPLKNFGPYRDIIL